MKRVLFVLVFMSLFLIPLRAQEYYGASNFDSDFQNATMMAPSGSEAAKGTDVMLRDTTGVLHKEHMAILEELAKIRKDIADLKRDTKSIKGQVE